MLNACISIVSSRKKCIPECLRSLWENYNHKYNYPVYVHYFDDIYDSEEFRKQISDTTPQDVHFISVPYETPSHIEEKELFYNRKNLWYVRASFPIRRKGYLHMCHFMCNMYGHEKTLLHKHDYIMTIDDESMFVKQMESDPFEVMKNREEVMGAMKVYDQREKGIHQGNYDTRVNLWAFIKGYLRHYNIDPKSDFLKNLLSDPEADENFNYYPCADSYVLKTSMFESIEWKQWMQAVNKFGGIYKYRWGDNDVYSLFYLIHHGDIIHDLKTVDDGYHSQGALRHLEDYAPGVKDNSK